jgi:hypothetical protein
MLDNRPDHQAENFTQGRTGNEPSGTGAVNCERHPERQVVLYGAAREALVQARTVLDAKDVQDRAAALQLYARMAQDRSCEQEAFGLRLRAVRRIGQMIRDQKATVGLNKGGRPRKTGSKKNPVLEPPTLAEAGIEKVLADQGRKLAAPSDKEFEQFVGIALKSEALGISVSLNLLAKELKIRRSNREQRLWEQIEDAARPHTDVVARIKQKYEELGNGIERELADAIKPHQDRIHELTAERDRKLIELRRECDDECRPHNDAIEELKRQHSANKGAQSNKNLKAVTR